MKYKQNLHTHTVRCDGIDTPEEMIAHAINKGFDSIGFSGHSHMPYSSYHHITRETTSAYKKEIYALKEKYKGIIDIYCGLEFEMLGDDDLEGWEYVIGSVHYLEKNGGIATFDRDASTVAGIIDQFFGGDGMEYAKSYYEHMARLPEYGKFDIIGHFDLITKHVDKADFFDYNSHEYLRYATDAMDALKGKIDLFEVNTGAISRGYRKTPYPMMNLLKELKARGFGAVISSDCHDGRYLDIAFDTCEEMLEECGFSGKYVLRNGKFEEIGLKE